MVPCDTCQGVSALATCSSQARECERRAELDEEEEEPKAKRLCGDSLQAARLDGDSPVAVKEAAAVADPDSEETAAVRLRQGTGGGQASAEVAQSTNLKRARNVGSLQFPPFFCCGFYFLLLIVAPLCGAICSWQFQWQAEHQRSQGSSRTLSQSCTSCRRGVVCLRRRIRDLERDMTAESLLKKMTW